jgi:HPt (histidine-containing phosphotransfer) domain-containing protein
VSRPRKECTRGAGLKDARRPSAREAHVFDGSQLARVAQGDAAFQNELLRLFAAHVPAIVGELRRARSRARWVAAAHALKGSALAVGARALARRAERAERLDVAASAARERALSLLAATAEQACCAALRVATVEAEPRLARDPKQRRAAS